MNLNNFLTSGHQFKEHESYLVFKYRVLNSFMLVAVVFGSLIGFFGYLGIMKIGMVQFVSNFIYAAINVLLLWQLRSKKEIFNRIAWVQVSISWLLFLIALVTVSNDEFRIMWFYVAVYISFMLLGTQAGIYFTISSIAAITLVDIYSDLNLSETAIMTATLGLVVFGLLSHAYTRQMTSYENQLNKQKNALEDSIREINDALEGAHAASQIKSLFLANMSHEIRTPMNGVLSMVQVLQTTQLDTQQRSYIKAIERSSKTLLTLLDDLLDLSRIESGRLDISNKEFKTWDCLEDVLTQVEPLFEDKPLGFSIDVSNELPGYLIGDEVRIKQVIVNLISNAAKFTDEGEVKVSVRGEEVGINNYHLSIEVSDTGSGIPEDKQKRIFEPFQQLSPDRIANKGVGLGLPICKKIIEAMKGELKVQSEPGKGSTFSIDLTLPLVKELDIKKKATISSSAPESLNILLVDDDQISRLAVKTLLSNKKHNVTIADNGAEAIHFLEQDYDYDAILMDVHMPVMNGVTATRVIKERKLTAAPVIGMTASVMNDERESYFEAGMDALVEKPINFENLMDIMRRKIS
ncbi:MAG: ATP-binding protein [Gammaproteobacteria bacterium]